MSSPRFEFAELGVDEWDIQALGGLGYPAAEGFIQVQWAIPTVHHPPSAAWFSGRELPVLSLTDEGPALQAEGHPVGAAALLSNDLRLVAGRQSVDTVGAGIHEQPSPSGCHGRWVIPLGAPVGYPPVIPNSSCRSRMVSARLRAGRRCRRPMGSFSMAGTTLMATNTGPLSWRMRPTLRSNSSISSKR